MQIGVGQHPATVVAQTEAGIVELGGRRIAAHVGTRSVFAFCMAHAYGSDHRHAATHGVGTVIHDHAAMIHARHAAVIHTRHITVIHAGHAAAHIAHHVAHG